MESFEWQELRSLTGFTDVIWKISFSADSEFLATGGEETASIWDINTGQSILTLEGQHAPIALAPWEIPSNFWG